MGIFRFIFTCITQAFKIAIGVALTIVLFFALGHVIDIVAARKTAPPADPRLKPYADRDVPLSGTTRKDNSDSLYLSFFETLLDKKPEVMPEAPPPEKKPTAAPEKKPEHPLSTPKKERVAAGTGQPPPAPRQTAAARRVAEIRAALLAASKQDDAGAEEALTYTLQLGSFQNSDVAASFSSSLESKGYKTFIAKNDLASKGTVYRVRLGRYESIEEAQKAAAELEKKEGISAFITSK